MALHGARCYHTHPLLFDCAKKMIRLDEEHPFLNDNKMDETEKLDSMDEDEYERGFGPKQRKRANGEIGLNGAYGV